MKKLISYGGKRQPVKPPYLKIALQITAVLLAILVVLVNLLTHVFVVMRYHGDGMEPTLQDGQLLVLQKTDQVRQGDMVAFYFNNKVLVRRIISDGSRIVSVDSTGLVTVDGQVLDEPYVLEPSIGMHTVEFPTSVPYGHYFVMGDNRAVAMDSRLHEIGCVPHERVIGKVILAF